MVDHAGEARRVASQNSRTISQKTSKLLLLIFLLVPTGLLRAATVPGLGSAMFPTSTHSAAAQEDFIRGLLLLHLFEYEEAARLFIAAQKADPSFAMAYWGEAMTFNHPVWNEVDVQAGRTSLARFGATPEARAQGIADPRERAWFSAVEILYSGAGSKPERDARYAAAMEQLSLKYPKDDEAQLFYALALLGKSEGVRDVPTYLQAAAIAKAVFMREPDHPGAAHYWIHAMDDPPHAAGALVPARALSKIAPSAAHAQHMCSHIFLALGMWDDVVRANIAASTVMNQQAAAAGKPPVRCGHSHYWLEYGYLEQGRIGEAKSVVAGCREQAMQPGMAAKARDIVDPDNAVVSSFVEMRSRYLVDTGRWQDEVAGWKVDMGGALMSEINDAFASGFAAAERGDLPTARDALAALLDLLPQSPAAFDSAGTSPGDPLRRVPQIQKLQLQAVILSAEGRGDQAVTLAQQAVAIGQELPYAFGPPSPEKPSYELLGEILLKEKRISPARAAFEASLQRAPQRTESLWGLARAEGAMGDKAGAVQTYRQLLEIWKNADPDYEAREKVQRSLSALSQVAN
jgi:tetratricopeptide (TPR) repeat protein